MIRLYKYSREKLINLRKSKYITYVGELLESQIIEIHWYRPHKIIHYGYLIRHLNHGILHLILHRRIGCAASQMLDNLEGTDKNWVVS